MSFFISHEVSCGYSSVFNSSSNLNCPCPHEQSGNNIGVDDKLGFWEGKNEIEFDGKKVLDGAKEGEKEVEGVGDAVGLSVWLHAISILSASKYSSQGAQTFGFPPVKKICRI